MHSHIASLLSHPAVRAAMERYLASQGRGGDTMIAHLNPQEAARLKAMGGSGTTNPHTGLPEFYAGGAGAGGVGGADQGGMGAHPGSDGPRGNSGGGGYGNASDGHSSGGSGAGAGGGHAGEGGGVNNPRPPVVTPPAPPVVQPPPGIAIAAAPPVTLAPQLSSTATKDLTGGRFGALPAWDLKPYNIGDAPTSYPVPGIDQPPPTGGGGGGAVPPPVTGGSGGNGGLGGGAGGGGTGDGSRNPWNNGGGTGQPGGTLAPGASYHDKLLAALGVTPKPQVAPPPAVTGPNPSQLAMMASLGVTPKPAPTAPQAPTGPTQRDRMLATLGVGPMLGGAPAPKAAATPMLGQTAKKPAKKATARKR